LGRTLINGGGKISWQVNTAELVAEGNGVCTQCHSPAGNPGFPTLKPADYDTLDHHFHEVGSKGAQCISCHAPERVYMGNDWRADHSFRIPRPDLFAQTGAPDACTTCHTDRDPDWAAAEIALRYPGTANRPQHYGQTLARGRQTSSAAANDLAGLAVDPGKPGIVRATALWLLEQENSTEIVNRIAPLLEDDDPLVRAAAAGVQRSASPQDRILRLLDRVTDPVRSVRIAAAKALLDAPIARLPRPQQAGLDAAMNTWRASLSSRLDFPETHLQLAGIALTMRAFPQADAAFREVVKLDPQHSEAWVMLVRLTAAMKGATAAKAVLDEAIAVLPGEPALLELREGLR
jgi:tetratricopeptide (TPR) repeat protein